MTAAHTPPLIRSCVFCDMANPLVTSGLLSVGWVGSVYFRFSGTGVFPTI